MKSEKKKAIRRGLNNNRKQGPPPGADGVRIILRAIIPGSPDHVHLYKSLGPERTVQMIQEQISEEAFNNFKVNYLEVAGKFEAMLRTLKDTGFPLAVGMTITIQGHEYQISRITYEFLETPAIRWAVEFVDI